MSLPVYSRADLSRIPELVVAPPLAALTTSVVAWEFHAADTRSRNDPGKRALRDMSRLIAARGGAGRQIGIFHSRPRAGRRKPAWEAIVADFGPRPFEAVMAGIEAKARRDPTVTESIELFRRME